MINKDNTPVLNWAVGKIWVNNHAHVLTAKGSNGASGAASKTGSIRILSR